MNSVFLSSRSILFYNLFQTLQPVPIAEIEQLDGVRVQVNDQVSCMVTLYVPVIIHKVCILQTFFVFSLFSS